MFEMYMYIKAQSPFSLPISFVVISVLGKINKSFGKQVKSLCHLTFTVK